MATMTVSIPDELKKRLDEFPEVKWTEVLRKEFIRKLGQIKGLEKPAK